MVFAKHLRVAGDEFRNKHLQSTDEADRTHYNEDWTQMKVKSQQSVSRTKCNDLFHLCTPGCTLQGILEEPCESGSPCSGWGGCACFYLPSSPLWYELMETSECQVSVALVGCGQGEQYLHTKVSHSSFSCIMQVSHGQNITMCPKIPLPHTSKLLSAAGVIQCHVQRFRPFQCEWIVVVLSLRAYWSFSLRLRWAQL